MLTTAFILTSLIVVLVPGTGVIYTVSMGLSGNRRQGIIAAVGCTLGIVPHLAAGILGISALMHTGAAVFRIIKIIGVLYLIYLGVGLIRDKSVLNVEGKDKTERNWKIIGKAVLLNLLNPKLTLFFLSFLPQFITDSSVGVTWQMVFLSLVFMALTLFIFIVYGLLANIFKNHIVESPRLAQRIQQGFGIALIGFAVKLAVSEN